MDERMKWDGAAWREVRDAKLLDWMLGNQPAVDAFLMLSRISEVWDDLIDGEPVDPEDVHGAFVDALVRLQGNPFYRQHEGILMGVVIAGINAWLDSVQLETTPTEAARMHAFYLRNFAYELINVCAFAVGGWRHMRAVSADMRAFFTHETYAQWEHRHAD
jgi:hypothetical protein